MTALKRSFGSHPRKAHPHTEWLMLSPRVSPSSTCQHCGRAVIANRITPDPARGLPHEERTFECSHCQHVQIEIFSPCVSAGQASAEGAGPG